MIYADEMKLEAKKLTTGNYGVTMHAAGQRISAALNKDLSQAIEDCRSRGMKALTAMGEDYELALEVGLTMSHADRLAREVEVMEEREMARLAFIYAQLKAKVDAADKAAAAQ